MGLVRGAFLTAADDSVRYADDLPLNTQLQLGVVRADSNVKSLGPGFEHLTEVRC